jgi:hypothetical protein
VALQDELHTGCGQIGTADVAIVRVKVSYFVATLTVAITSDGDLSIGKTQARDRQNEDVRKGPKREMGKEKCI